MKTVKYILLIIIFSIAFNCLGQDRRVAKDFDEIAQEIIERNPYVTTVLRNPVKHEYRAYIAYRGNVDLVFQIENVLESNYEYGDGKILGWIRFDGWRKEIVGRWVGWGDFEAVIYNSDRTVFGIANWNLVGDALHIDFQLSLRIYKKQFIMEER